MLSRATNVTKTLKAASVCIITQDVVLSQGEPRDAAVTFDTYLILQRHRAVSLPLHDFLVYINDHSNAEITHTTLIFTALMQCRKSRTRRK